jgi:arylsulfatase A-like enzyme
MTFDIAFVATPSCAPSRSVLLTGLMPARNGAEANHTVPSSTDLYLTKRLQAAGYRVAAFGKVADGGSPPAKGFGFWNNVPEGGDLSGAVAKYYGGLADKSKPVCLMVGDHRPHVSWTANSIYRAEDMKLPPYLIDTKETREHWARYLTDITAMDTELGQVYTWAKSTFGDNLIFLYSSDHGAQWPFGKWNLYDAGIKVPLIFVAPGRIAPDVRTPAMVSWVDILPTLFDMAGIPLPTGLDGTSFQGVLTGKTAVHRTHIFTTHSADGQYNIFPIRSVRTAEYKYILNPFPQFYHSNHSDMDRLDGAGAYWDSWDSAAAVDSAAANIRYRYYVRPREEFYALADDPLEQNNLIGKAQYAAKIREMHSLLTDWMASQKDTATIFGTPYPITGPRPKNTDTIRPWPVPVGLARRSPVRPQPKALAKLFVTGRDGADGREGGGDAAPRVRTDGRTVVPFRAATKRP